MANLDARAPAPSRKSKDAGVTAGPRPRASGPASVDRVFHSLILPELARSAQDAAGDSEQTACSEDVTADEITQFCDLLVHSDVSQAVAYMNALRARGVEYDKILTRLFTDSARQLGIGWEYDTCRFGDVSVGMSRLHQVLQHLATQAPFSPAQLQTRGRALLAPCPGEQHNFGLMMLDHMFHRAGWELRTIPIATDNQLTRITASSNFDLVGLSLSCDEKLSRLEKTISLIRRESRNQRIVVLVGGRVFNDNPSLAAQIGADAAPPSATAALVVAEVLMDIRKDVDSAAHNLALG
jgi:methanogenic corrinoid protein MtbC1